MEPIWLKQYPAGVPATIDPDQYTSIRQLFDAACARYGDAPAFTNMGTTLSYTQLDQASRAFAAWLQQHAGLEAGDRIALMMPNILQYPVTLFGALRAGMVVVNTNPLYTARELEHQLSDSGARAIVILENFAHVLQHALPQIQVRTVIVTAVGDLLSKPRGWLVNFVVRHVHKRVPKWRIPGARRFMDILTAGRSAQLQPAGERSSDIAFLQYTGGTTGVAKGAILSNRNMIANVLQADAWISPSLPPPGGRIVITALPLYHIFSLTANCLLFVTVGAHNILITNPRDFAGFVKELKKYRFFFISGVNTLFNALLNQPEFGHVDFSALRVTLGGGMAVQAAVAARWKKVTGCVLTQAWGLTETSPAACINPVGLDFNGSIGLPIPSTEVSIRGDDGAELNAGGSGEICVRGPQVTRGYWNRRDETAKVFFGDWLRTGDIGHVDAAGFVYIDDRKKDMILVSGFNVYPNEIEGVVAEHPGVLEVAAVAQPDEASGESVALFVVRKDPNLTATALIEHCRQSLTGYKIPKHIYFRDELPKTNVGKIMRRALREELTVASGAATHKVQAGT
ncbi:MAG: AMP-binding protein [Steroidobacterales bacterium]